MNPSKQFNGRPNWVLTILCLTSNLFCGTNLELLYNSTYIYTCKVRPKLTGLRCPSTYRSCNDKCTIIKWSDRYTKMAKRNFCIFFLCSEVLPGAFCVFLLRHWVGGCSNKINSNDKNQNIGSILIQYRWYNIMIIRMRKHPTSSKIKQQNVNVAYGCHIFIQLVIFLSRLQNCYSYEVAF